MFTETGKKLAKAQTAKTVAFFDALLDDLETWGIASFERRTIVLEEDFAPATARLSRAWK